MSAVEPDFARWERVCAAAEQHGHQGFRVTPAFFRAMLAEHNQLLTLLAQAGSQLDDLAQADWLQRDWPPLKGAVINGLLAKIAAVLPKEPTS